MCRYQLQEIPSFINIIIRRVIAAGKARRGLAYVCSQRQCCGLSEDRRSLVHYASITASIATTAREHRRRQCLKSGSARRKERGPGPEPQ